MVAINLSFTAFVIKSLYVVWLKKPTARSADQGLKAKKFPIGESNPAPSLERAVS